MNTEYVDGFLSASMQAGLSKEEATELLKLAAAEDPNMAAALAGGAPQQLGQGQPPLPAAPEGGGGVPPEIEELIQSLPPEVLQQLIAEIEQEMQHGGVQPPQGHPPQGHPPQGHPPQGMPKQGEESILSKTAEYAEGFFSNAVDHGLTRNEAANFYKQAVSIMEKSPVDPTLFLDSKEKQANHYDGFVRAALDHGLSVKGAQGLYLETFVNK